MSALDFTLLKVPDIENEPQPEGLDEGGSISDIVVSPSGQLTPVEELEIETAPIGTPSAEGLDGKPIDDTGVPGIENMNTQVDTKVQTGSVKKALLRMQKATGLNFDQPQPKPPPSIMIEKGVCRAYLQGMCYLTVAPLVHLLINGLEDDVFVIEVDLPYLHSSDFITLASAMEQSASKVEIAVRRVQSMYLMMMMHAADKVHVAPNVHSIGPMSGFSMGSGLDMETTTDAFKAHEKFAQQLLLDKGFLTEDELAEINTKAKLISFTTEELLSRVKQD